MGRGLWLTSVTPCSFCGLRHRASTPRDEACEKHYRERAARARVKAGPRKRAESNKNWRHRTARTPRAVATALRRSAATQGYEITVEERDERLDAQGHRCVVCQRPFRTPTWHLVCTFTGVLTGRRVPKSPHVDHDHETGAVRGLLCLWCNRNIMPLFDKYFEVMVRARKYRLQGGWRTE